MLGHRDQVALHQPAGRFLRVSQRFLDRGAVVGLHRPEHRALLVLLEILEDGDRVVGLHLPGEVGDLLGRERVEQRLADVLVHFRQHVGVDDPGERFHQPLALVARGEFDQIGDVGGVERLDQLRAR